MSGSTERTRQLLRSGGMLPIGTQVPKELPTDIVAGRAYRHPVLGDRTVVRLCPKTLVAGEELEMSLLGFGRGEELGDVGHERRRALGFPGWALVHDPKHAKFALEVVREFKKEARRARSKPGHAKDGIDAIAARLQRSVPHFLPSFYEEAGRAFIEHGALSYASTMFGKARESEEVHALQIDEANRISSFLEFALAGAVTTKSLAAYAKELSKLYPAEQAYQHFRQLCVQRTLGGMPPWAGMAKELRRLAAAAKLDVEAEDRWFLGEVLRSPALARAAGDFWRSYAPVVRALAKDSPSVRGLLLNVFPAPSSSGEGFDEEWLALLDDCDATRALCEDGAPADAQPTAGRAAWFDKMLAHVSRGWRDSTPPARVFELLRRMAPRLAADGAPISCIRRFRRVDLDLIEAALELGVPVSASENAMLDLKAWASEARSPGRGRDPIKTAAHPVLGTLLADSVAAAIGEEPFDSVARGKAGLLAAKRAWLEGLLDGAERGGLPAVEEVLDAVRTRVRSGTFAEMPDLHTRFAKLAVAPALARTLRAGLLDELGWPALEAAAVELEPDGRGLWVSGAFPIVVIGNRARAIALGHDRRLGEHDLKLPAQAELVAARYVGGQFLVVFSQSHALRAYWSANPNDVFDPEANQFEISVMSERAAMLPDGRVFEGDAGVGVGERRVPRSGNGVSCDGVTCWRVEWNGQEQRLREVSARTGELGRFSMPTFFEQQAAEGWRIDPLLSYVLPAPAGISSPLGQREAQVGMCVRHRGPADSTRVYELHTIDGRSWKGLAAGGVPIALLRLPGDDSPRPIVHRSQWHRVGTTTLVDASGTYTGSRMTDQSATYARGQSAHLPVVYWHLMTPRDATGSGALRRVTDEQATALMAACAAAEPSIEARAQAATAALGKILPEVSHARLALGVGGVTGIAASCAIAHRELVADRAPNRAAPPVADLEDALLEGALFGLQVTAYYAYGPTGTVAAQLQQSTDVLLSKDPTDRIVADLPKARVSWAPLLFAPGVLVFLSQAAALEEPQQQAVRRLLRVLGDSPLAKLGGALRLSIGSISSTSVTCQGDTYGRWSGGNAYLIRRLEQHGTVGRAIVLEHAASGSFRPLEGFTPETEQTGGAWPTPAIARFLERVTARPLPDSTQETVARLAAETGLATAEAAVLWAGCPNLHRYEAAFLTKEVRERLGLKSAAAATARDNLRAVPAEHRLQVLAAAGDAMLADPESVWTPLGAGGPVERMAARWVALQGKRIAVPDDLLVAADRDVECPLKAGQALTLIASPQSSPRLNRDVRWRLAAEGRGPEREPADVDGEAFDVMSLSLSFYLPYLFAALPVGDPLRAQLPVLHEVLRARLRNPELWLKQGTAGFYGPKAAEEGAKLLDVLGGDPLPPPLEGRRLPGAAVVRHSNQYMVNLELFLKPAEVRGDADYERIAGIAQHFMAYQTFPLTYASLVDSEELARMMARIRETPVPAGRWEQDPSVSTPELVQRAQARLGVSPEAAALYLQTLTLAAPTSKAVQLWNGWSPAAYKKHVAELVERGLLVEAKRERSGRAHFLPGPWLALKAPHSPMETWKLPLYDVTDAANGPPLGRYHLLIPVHEAFARAWKRIEAGDVPRFEDVPGAKK